jgi:hypothetical protein
MGSKQFFFPGKGEEMEERRRRRRQARLAERRRRERRQRKRSWRDSLQQAIGSPSCRAVVFPTHFPPSFMEAVAL